MKNIQKGFTLIELMVTIAIMAIMLAIAIPNLSEWVAKRRVAAAAEKVANMIRFGRSEAARLNSPVYLCPVQIRTDGNPNGYCKSDNEGSGLALWADSDPYDKKYQRGIDQSLRTVILNKVGDIRVRSQILNINYSGEPVDSRNGANTKVLAFLPDGTIRRYDVDNNGIAGVGYPISGYVKYEFTDGQAKDKSTLERRSVIMLVSGNQVSFCDSSNTSESCKYTDFNIAKCNKYGGCQK